MIQPLHNVWMRYRGVRQRLDRRRSERVQRRYADESQNKAELRLLDGMVEALAELRGLVDVDTTLPTALADHLREDRWNDPKWLLEAVVLGQPQLFRVLGHRVRAAAEWSVDDAAIDTTEPGRVIVLHPASTTWIGVDNLGLVSERWWWGRVRVGRINHDGTLAEHSFDLKLTEIAVPSLRRSLPGAFTRLVKPPALEVFAQAQDPAMLTAVVVDTLKELREVAEYDPQVPAAVAQQLSEERWQETHWMLEAAGTSWSLFPRVIGHRLRAAAGWMTKDAAVDTDDAHRVLVVHATDRVWVCAERPCIVAGRWWWGRLSGGTLAPDDSPGPLQARGQPTLLDRETLLQDVPDLLGRIADAVADGVAYDVAVEENDW
ncbi:hypothetical protein [Streptacidiphilus sp. MAP5-52]|uniref:hypothetical protein n=1 Tax=Streptacidiphilus sp. MAP5-52 TaxID=3156267 RepID=UPI003515104D